MSQKKDNNIISHQPVEIQSEILHTTPFLKLKENNGYYFAERKGIDSVAFVLFDINATEEKRIGLIKEIKPPINKAIIGAFGGSIDKEYEDLRTLVCEEVLEESGFNITFDNIDYYGRVFVSTQMNQFCHLFGIRVDKFKQGLRTTTNPTELSSIITWVSLPEINQLEDWKAITIIAKKMTSESTRIYAMPIVNKTEQIKS